MSLAHKELHVALRRWGNVVMMKVIKTPLAFVNSHKSFRAQNGVSINSDGGAPMLSIVSPNSGSGNIIYLHGTCNAMSNSTISIQSFIDEEQAKKALTLAKDALEDFEKKYTSGHCDSAGYPADPPSEDVFEVKGQIS
jgi:Fe-S cluster biogenesis protein NfuA